MVNADFWFGTYQKSDRKLFCSPTRVFPLPPELVYLKLVVRPKRYTYSCRSFHSLINRWEFKVNSAGQQNTNFSPAVDKGRKSQVWGFFRR